MGPRRRPRSGGGSWAYPAGQKTGRGPIGRPAKVSGSGLPENKGAREGSLWLG